jgi:hypothetical protein
MHDSRQSVIMEPPSTPKSLSRLSTRSRSSTPSSKRSKVIGGRIGKKSPRSPNKKLQVVFEDMLDDEERVLEQSRFEEMEKEKLLFPGSHEWAADEDRLFELLFMRQFMPLLPSHWDIDFRSIPIPDILFATSDIDRPVIYSSSENQFKGEFRTNFARWHINAPRKPPD